MWTTIRILVIQTFVSHHIHDNNIGSIYRQRCSSDCDSDFTGESATALNCYNHRKKWKSIPFIIPEKEAETETVILPGETKTIWTDETKLIEDVFPPNLSSDDNNDKDNTMVAVGICLGDEEVMEVASLCEIQACTCYNGQYGIPVSAKSHAYTDAKGYFLTVECIGRIKLEELDQENYYSRPYPKFYYSIAEEIIPEEHLRESQMVAENIETFMKILPTTVTFATEDLEEENGDKEEEYEAITMISKFKTSYDKTLNVFEKFIDATAMTMSTSSSPNLKHEKSSTVKSLIAISWAAFTAAMEGDNDSDSHGTRIMDSNSMSYYRIRALDYDNVFDRLKLAQYMLRERELRTQGMRLLQDPSDDDSKSITNNIDNGGHFFSLDDEASFE